MGDLKEIKIHYLELQKNDVLIEHHRTKPQNIPEYKLNIPMETFSFDILSK